MEHIKEEAQVWDLMVSHFNEKEYAIDLRSELDELEKSRINSALLYCEGNRTKAAKQLGIGRTLLLHKIKKYNLLA